MHHAVKLKGRSVMSVTLYSQIWLLVVAHHDRTPMARSTEHKVPRWWGPTPWQHSYQNGFGELPKLRLVSASSLELSSNASNGDGVLQRLSVGGMPCLHNAAHVAPAVFKARVTSHEGALVIFADMNHCIDARESSTSEAKIQGSDKLVRTIRACS
eukprot:4408154-Amphidinium_carterae.2